MSLRPSKEHALKAALELTPKYAELLKDIQSGNGRISFSPEIASIHNNVGTYVLMYDDERKIGRAILLFLLGEEGLREFVAESKLMSDSEQQDFVNELTDIEKSELIQTFDQLEIPSTQKEWQAARDALAALPEEERKEAQKRGVYLWSCLFSGFFNTLSLMVHGSKLTTLVPLALAGDDKSFLKSVQIDRMLLLHHPYFRDRKIKAQNEGEVEFLRSLSYREANPPARGRIQYPALYMLFGILESYGWLDDLKHKEILNICDDAGLDLYQNRIEDVNYLTKRLAEYRELQKIGGMSMHSN